LTDIDKKKYDRLLTTLEHNFRITRLYADYLNLCPELIKSEMVEALTEGGDITACEALVAILSEAFSLDFEQGTDRRLIMDYLTPSVRMLDAERYYSNPYYKNIKIPNIIDGSWELRSEVYPAYRGMIAGDIIFDGLREIPPLGFFPCEFRFPAVLEDGNEWMTLTPVDVDTCDGAIEAAHGKVVTFGLGLGYYAYMVSEKPDVDSITVIEKSPDVIALFKKHILPQFRHKDKVRIIESDAFEYAEHRMPSERFDYAFVDTWRDASDGAPMYERMKRLEHLSPDTEFSYWIENFLISRLRAGRAEELFSGRYSPRSYTEAEDFLKNIL